jgi:hypothetical protein
MIGDGRSREAIESLDCGVVSGREPMGLGLKKGCEPIGLGLTKGCEPMEGEMSRGCRCPVARIAEIKTATCFLSVNKINKYLC